MTRVGASERGQQTSFNRADGISDVEHVAIGNGAVGESDIEGKAAVGSDERVGKRASFKIPPSPPRCCNVVALQREQRSDPYGAALGAGEAIDQGAEGDGCDFRLANSPGTNFSSALTM